MAAENAKKSANKGKQQYDKCLRSSILKVGDRVLVKNLVERGGPGKLRSFWEEKVHVVIRRLSDDSPVYEIQPEGGDGRKRVLHRNLLHQCDFLPLEGEAKIKRKKLFGRKTRDRRRPRSTDVGEETDSDSESAQTSSSSATWIPNLDAPIFHPRGIGPDPPVENTETPVEVVQLPLSPDEDRPDGRPTLSSGEDLPVGRDNSGNGSDLPGSSPNDDDSSLNEEMDTEGRPTRVRKVPYRLTYNRMGHPSNTNWSH